MRKVITVTFLSALVANTGCDFFEDKQPRNSSPPTEAANEMARQHAAKAQAKANPHATPTDPKPPSRLSQEPALPVLAEIKQELVQLNGNLARHHHDIRAIKERIAEIQEENRKLRQEVKEQSERIGALQTQAMQPANPAPEPANLISAGIVMETYAIETASPRRRWFFRLIR